MEDKDRYKKFATKNKDILELIDVFIDENKDHIRCIVTSIELSFYLAEQEGGECLGLPENEMYKYRDILITVNPYYPTSLFDFVMREEHNSFKFNMPCVCGIYEDEKHEELK